jgi:hypothetical protein
VRTIDAKPVCDGRIEETLEDHRTNRRRLLVKQAVSVVLAAVLAFMAAPVAAQTIVTIQQVSSNRYVDAHEHAGEDYRLVTRAAQNNSTQLWRMTQIDGQVYTFQQVSSGRFMDAHEHAGEDYRLVTRPAQNNDTQRWLVIPLGGDIYTIQQVSNGRYVDAHEVAGEDYRLVTRPAQNNATQQWRIATVLVEAEPTPPAAVTFSTGAFELPPALTVNLDNGVLGPVGADLAYQGPNLAELRLVPINGAEISFAGGAQRGFAGCSAAAYGATPVVAATLTVGNYVCVRTNAGRISEFRINAIGPLLRVLTIGYTTWQ